MKYKPCPKCRASNAAKDLKCFSCGQTMEEPKLDPVQPSQPPTATRKFPFLLVFLLLVLVGVSVGGWMLGRDDTNLRVEVTRLNTGAGLIPASAKVKQGETVHVDIQLRGWTPEDNGNCKGEVSMVIEGPWPLFFQSPYQKVAFLKRSKITHIPITQQILIPEYLEPGEYTVKVKVRDLIANKTAEFSHPIHVDGATIDRDRRAHQACVATIEAITAATIGHLGRNHKAAQGMDDLVPEYFAEPPHCPAAKASSYRLLFDGSVTQIYCEGHWHKAAGAREDHPFYSGVFQSHDEWGGGSIEDPVDERF